MGDGCSTKTWEDPWVTSFSLHEILSLKPQNSPLVWVPELKEGNQWNDVALIEMFSPIEIVAIKKIPRREGSCQDQRIWKYSKQGTFLVKSAYHAQTEITIGQNLNSASSSATVFNIIFFMECPTYIASYLWLRTYPKKKKKHAAIENAFYLCGELNETMEHLFLKCHSAWLYGLVLHFPFLWVIVLNDSFICWREF